MARQEEDREDLLRDATAFVERVALRIGTFDPLFLGFRRCGSVSVYFGQDQVYHFNSQNQLRRVYLAPRLLKAERGRLVGLSRNRTANETQLLRVELSAEETEAILQDARDALTGLADSLASQAFEVVGEVSERGESERGESEHGKVVERAADWARRMTASGELSVADSPHAW